MTPCGYLKTRRQYSMTLLISLKLHLYLSGAVELRNSLASQFHQELPSTIIFDYPNALGLATFILSRQDKAAGAESEDSESSQDDEVEAVGDTADVSAIR